MIFVGTIIASLLLLVLYTSQKGNYGKRLLIQKLLNITYDFNYNYQKSIQCVNATCLFKCLVKYDKENKFKPYTDKDIPGPYPFDYPLLDNNKNKCNEKTQIFISVITSCKQLEERMAVRKVYQNINSTIQIHFFIGFTSAECQSLYIQEKEMFKDISQMPIQESFVNETLFTLYLHKILPRICPSAKYYGKMDADQYVDYPNLLKLLESNKDKYMNLSYVCNVWYNFYISDNQKWKYSSPAFIAQYYKTVFPKGGIVSYTGSFALWPNYLSQLIYNESLNEAHIIRMDDQHISWLIYRLNKKVVTNMKYFELKCLDIGNSRGYKTNTKYGIHRLKGRVLYSFHKLKHSKSYNISSKLFCKH